MDHEKHAVKGHSRPEKRWMTLTHSLKQWWWENSQISKHTVAVPSRSTRKSDILEVSLNLSFWWKPHAVNGLLEAHAIVPVDNTCMMRDISCYHDCRYTGDGVIHPHSHGWITVPVAVTQDQLEEDPHEINTRMTIVTILGHTLKLSDGVNYTRVRTCRLYCTHCWTRDMFSFISCFHRIWV